MRSPGWLLVIIAGCAPAAPDDATSHVTTGVASSDSTGATATAGMTSTTGTVDASTTLVPGETSSSDEGAEFIVPPDGGGPDECDLWDEDCPRGMKCMPWANDGSNVWNSTRCSPIARDPAQVGEPCTVEGNGVSGLDDCALHSMCWYVDPVTNIGECVAFCTGSRANPMCPEDTSCTISSSGVLILCLDYCDPLLQDCARGEACYPVNESFECTDDNSGDTGQPGDSCAWQEMCDVGLFCASGVPGCQVEGCCAPFCDTSDPNASTECDAVLPGTACVPWYERGQEPPGYENVGTCTEPQ